MKEKNKFLTFLRRRFVRIFPVYWLIISLFLAAQLLFPSFYRTHFPVDIKNLLSTYLLFPGHIMVNGVSWTLSYELFFYIVFSLAYIIPDKKKAFVIGAVFSLIIIFLPFLGYNYQNENIWLSLITNPMNIEFFLGVLCVVLVQHFPKKLSIPFIITGTVLFVAGSIITDFGYHLTANGFNRVILFGIPSFFIILGIVKYELTTAITIPKVFLNLGDASYSLYLLHLPLIAASCKVMILLHITHPVLINISLLALIIIISYGSILFYKRFEKPVIASLNNLRKIKAVNEI
jgi:peptidoglycan/LPS O-acetylase OafA/YrhL